MRFDYKAQGLWAELNEEVETKLDLAKSASRARIFKGLSHALFEITQGLIKQFPHRKKIFYFKGQDPSHDLAMMALSREGCMVQALPLSTFDAPEEFVASIDKDALFILYSEDDPILGKKFPVEKLEKLLKEKKIFRVSASHHAFRFQDDYHGIDKEEVRVFSLKNNLALALLGERAKMTPLVVEGLPWREDAKETIFKELAEHKEQKKIILDFENQKPGDATPFFKEGDLRVFDRAILYWKDMDGWAFLSELGKELGIQFAEPGEDQRFETTSHSRWHDLRAMGWLKNHGLDAEQIRGLVIVDAGQITPKLAETFAKVRARILKQQGTTT